jgi:O-antigen/teichoic acid export membrane protein
MLVVSSIFYSLWLKNKVLPDLHLLFFLMINTFCLMKSTLYRSFMNSVGKIRLQFVVTVIQAILHIPVAIFLGKQFGAIGVACTMLIWNLINAIWEPIQFKKIITNTAKGIWQK